MDRARRERKGGRRELEDGQRSEDEQDDDHLAEVEDGCGCTEIWEHLAERRAADQ